MGDLYVNGRKLNTGDDDDHLHASAPDDPVYDPAFEGYPDGSQGRGAYPAGVRLPKPKREAS